MINICHLLRSFSYIQESILAATDPNRIHWMSGTVNVPGTPTNPDGEGGMILDNNATPGESSLTTFDLLSKSR